MYGQLKGSFSIPVRPREATPRDVQGFLLCVLFSVLFCPLPAPSGDITSFPLQLLEASQSSGLLLALYTLFVFTWERGGSAQLLALRKPNTERPTATKNEKNPSNAAAIFQKSKCFLYFSFKVSFYLKYNTTIPFFCTNESHILFQACSLYQLKIRNKLKLNFTLCILLLQEVQGNLEMQFRCEQLHQPYLALVKFIIQIIQVIAQQDSNSLLPKALKTGYKGELFAHNCYNLSRQRSLGPFHTGIPIRSACQIFRWS